MEDDIKLFKTIHLRISSENKPSYRGSKNWILLQDSDTNQKWSSLRKKKDELTEKFSPLLNKFLSTDDPVNRLNG